jgi:hypothetical protein
VAAAQGDWIAVPACWTTLCCPSCCWWRKAGCRRQVLECPAIFFLTNCPPCRLAPSQPESTVSSLQTAMSLYGCTHYEWLQEPQHDMNCLLAWGPDALLITFRGTQSLANIKADAKVGCLWQMNGLWGASLRAECCLPTASVVRGLSSCLLAPALRPPTCYLVHPHSPWCSSGARRTRRGGACSCWAASLWCTLASWPRGWSMA